MIRSFGGYISADKDFLGVRLNANEGCQGDFNRYPQKRSEDILTLFSQLYGVATENLMMDRGIDGILEVIFSAFIERGDKVLGLSPTYGMYSVLSNMRGADYFEIESACLETEIQKRSPKLLLLCRPNNPTGEILPREKVLEAIGEMSNNSLIVIDEAYIEFDEEETLVDLIKDYPNLLVLRTLSKAYSLASLRVGFGIGASSLIKKLIPFQTPYPTSGLVLKFLKENFTPQFIDETRQEIQRVKTWRERLTPFFDEKGGNFLYRKDSSSSKLYQVFKENGVLIRYFPKQQAIRLSIGSDLEMKIVEALCEKWL